MLRQIPVEVAPWQPIPIIVDIDQFCFYGGIATGKSAIGSIWAIDKMTSMPDVTGFIGSNTYDQMSTATLRELFFWLTKFGIPYVIDEMPPAAWGFTRKEFKSYKNILSVYIDGKIVHVFTRVLSEPDALRGFECTWYWLDEIRDTRQDTHDVLVGRLRESDDLFGLCTTTTNGEGWDYKRFVLGADGKTYGSMHVPTTESLRIGLITNQYFNMLLKTYSPLMAEQEIHARHVNVFGGRAYYAASDKNKKRIAPWGDRVPNVERPLIVGADFNYSPAPHIWMIGQVGPGEYHNRIHWFAEIAEKETGTPEMAKILMMRYPDFFYEIYGDASGGRGTTSNSGQHDFNQISQVINGGGGLCTINVDWDDEGHAKGNPRVKNRVENMNAMFCNGLGERRQTYNPDTCPMFDADIRMVGWKTISAALGRAKLDDGGDINRTHASDGGGYAVWKKFPPGYTMELVSGIPSSVRSDLRGAL